MPSSQGAARTRKGFVLLHVDKHWHAFGKPFLPLVCISSTEERIGCLLRKCKVRLQVKVLVVGVE